MFSKIERAPSLDEVPAAVEIQLRAGDAACFVDCLAHGQPAESIQNKGEYWLSVMAHIGGNDRYGFQPSSELVSRLTAEKRQIVQPLPPRRSPVEA